MHSNIRFPKTTARNFQRTGSADRNSWHARQFEELQTRKHTSGTKFALSLTR